MCCRKVKDENRKPGFRFCLSKTHFVRQNYVTACRLHLKHILWTTSTCLFEVISLCVCLCKATCFACFHPLSLRIAKPGRWIHEEQQISFWEGQEILASPPRAIRFWNQPILITNRYRRAVFSVIN